MAVIKVPKTPRKSFNPDRRPSALLLDQIRHLEWAALPAAQRAPGRGLPTKTVTTEGAAAERIAQLTTLIHEQQARPYTPGEVARVTLPPLPGPAPARESARAPKPGRAAARTKTSRKSPSRKSPTRKSCARKTATPRRRTAAAKATSARKRGNRGRKSR
jgi:hypothetical protein